MKKLKVYLDTSVIGGCFDKEFDHDSNQIINNIKLGLIDGVVSVITVNELIDAPEDVQNLFSELTDLLTILEVNDEVINLSSEYLANKIVSEKFAEDTLHIAIATVYNLDVLISWNFKHIVNLNKIKQFNAINLSQGYQQLEIRSPKEIIYEE